MTRVDLQPGMIVRAAGGGSTRWLVTEDAKLRPLGWTEYQALWPDAWQTDGENHQRRERLTAELPRSEIDTLAMAGLEEADGESEPLHEARAHSGREWPIGPWPDIESAHAGLATLLSLGQEPSTVSWGVALFHAFAAAGVHNVVIPPSRHDRWTLLNNIVGSRTTGYGLPNPWAPKPLVDPATATPTVGADSPWAIENLNGRWHPFTPRAVMTRPPNDWNDTQYRDVLDRYVSEGFNFLHVERWGASYDDLHRLMAEAKTRNLGVWLWMQGDEEHGRANRHDFPPHSETLVREWAREMGQYTNLITGFGFDLDEWLQQGGAHATFRLFTEIAPQMFINARPGQGANNVDGEDFAVIDRWNRPDGIPHHHIIYDAELHRPTSAQVQELQSRSGGQLAAASDRYRNLDNQHPEKDMRSHEEMRDAMRWHLQADVAAIYGWLRGHVWSASFPAEARP